MNLNKLVKLSGDASFRHFYRSRNSIIVYCVKNKKSNLLDYDAINKILIKKKSYSSIFNIATLQRKLYRNRRFRRFNSF